MAVVRLDRDQRVREVSVLRGGYPGVQAGDIVERDYGDLYRVVTRSVRLPTEWDARVFDLWPGDYIEETELWPLDHFHEVARHREGLI